MLKKGHILRQRSHRHSAQKVFIFHSPEAASKFFHGEIHLTPLEWEEKLPKDISDFMEHMKRYRIAHAGRSVPGSIGRMITMEAFSKRHDLIIMGASQRSMLSSILRGNPVEEVLRNTPCDLIILKPRRDRVKIHNLTKEEVLLTLVTSENGLSEEEAKRRLSEFGFNEIKEAKKNLSISDSLNSSLIFSDTPLGRSLYVIFV